MFARIALIVQVMGMNNYIRFSTFFLLIIFLTLSSGITVSKHYCYFCEKSEYFIFSHQPCCAEDSHSHEEHHSCSGHHHEANLQDIHQTCSFDSCQTEHYILKINAPYSNKKFEIKTIVQQPAVLESLFEFYRDKSNADEKLREVFKIPPLIPLKENFLMVNHQWVYYA